MSSDGMERFGTCQMRGCGRSASGRYTRSMYSAEDGEEWPEDVSERPICWFHHWLEKSLMAAIAGGMFGLMFGVVWFGTEMIA